VLMLDINTIEALRISSCTGGKYERKRKTL